MVAALGPEINAVQSSITVGNFPSLHKFMRQRLCASLLAHRISAVGPKAVPIRNCRTCIVSSWAKPLFCILSSIPENGQTSRRHASRCTLAASQLHERWRRKNELDIPHDDDTYQLHCGLCSPPPA